MEPCVSGIGVILMLLFKMPKIGARKITVRFAFLPVRLGKGNGLFNSGSGGDVIWMERYDCLEEFTHCKETLKYKWVIRERRKTRKV